MRVLACAEQAPHELAGSGVGEVEVETRAVERARPQPRDEDATRILDPEALSAARESGPHERRVARRRTANLGLTALIVVIVAVGAWFALEGLPFFNADTGVERVALPTDALVRPEPPPALPPQVAARIARLLDVAQMHMAVGRQCEPPGSSAYEAYALVVEMDPQNAEARAAYLKMRDAGQRGAIPSTLRLLAVLLQPT